MYPSLQRHDRKSKHQFGDRDTRRDAYASVCISSLPPKMDLELSTSASTFTSAPATASSSWTPSSLRFLVTGPFFAKVFLGVASPLVAFFARGVLDLAVFAAGVGAGVGVGDESSSAASSAALPLPPVATPAFFLSTPLALRRRSYLLALLLCQIWVSMMNWKHLRCSSSDALPFSDGFEVDLMLMSRRLSKKFGL